MANGFAIQGAYADATTRMVGGIPSQTPTRRQEPDSETAKRDTIDARGFLREESNTIAGRREEAQKKAFQIALAAFRGESKVDEKLEGLRDGIARLSDSARIDQDMARQAREDFATLEENAAPHATQQEKDNYAFLEHFYDELAENRGGYVEQETFERVLHQRADRIRPASEEEYLRLDEADRRLLAIDEDGMSDYEASMLSRHQAIGFYDKQASEATDDAAEKSDAIRAVHKERRKGQLMEDAAEAKDEALAAVNRQVIDAAMRDAVAHTEDEAEETSASDDAGEVGEKGRKEKDDTTDGLRDEQNFAKEHADALGQKRSVSEEDKLKEAKSIRELEPAAAPERVRGRIANLVEQLGVSMEDIKGGMVDSLL